MEKEKLTHWKKNNDSRYISGEDLHDGISINKGLKPEMVVVIDSFQDSETFDQNNQKNVVKTGFFLKELDSGKPLYKPVILNNTNADFCIKEFGSQYMEHWIGKPFILYAKPDKRHGHVARFKKYYAKPTISDTEALSLLDKATTLDELKERWETLKKDEKTLPTVMAKKEEMKVKLSKPVE
jgi:hypothetical protein